MERTRRKISLVIAALASAGLVATLLRPTPVHAEARWKGGNNYFDAEFYALMYPDVVASVGNAESALYNHYKTIGAKQGKLPYNTLAWKSVPDPDFPTEYNLEPVSPYARTQLPDGRYFNADYYAENNPDLVAVLGFSPDALYQHFIHNGQKEGRMPSFSAYLLHTMQTDNASPEARAYILSYIGEFDKLSYYELNMHDYLKLHQDFARDRVIALINGERVRAGLKPLVKNDARMQNAQAIAKVGKTQFLYFDNQPITVVNGTSFDNSSVPDGAVEYWMRNPVSRQLILNPAATTIGAGADIDKPAYSDGPGWAIDIG